MLFFSLWPDGGGHASYDDGLRRPAREQAARDELSAVVDLSFDAARHHALRLLGGPLSGVPLRVHARYQREEVLAALDYASLDRRPNSFREGVLYVAEAQRRRVLRDSAEVGGRLLAHDDVSRLPDQPDAVPLGVTVDDIGRSKTGQRYVNGTSTVLLFVREQQRDEFGTAPYLFLGPATYVRTTGERPIAITWRLAHPMPADFFTSASVAAG